MLPLTLYADDTLTMQVTWLGLGALVVVDRRGRARRATPLQKLFAEAVADELTVRGVSATSGEARRAAMQKITYAIWESPPDSTRWETMFDDGPDALATFCIGSSA